MVGHVCLCLSLSHFNGDKCHTKGCQKKGLHWNLSPATWELEGCPQLRQQQRGWKITGSSGPYTPLMLTGNIPQHSVFGLLTVYSVQLLNCHFFALSSGSPRPETSMTLLSFHLTKCCQTSFPNVAYSHLQCPGSASSFMYGKYRCHSSS